MKATEKFPGVGVFDHLEWTYDGAFEQLFGLGRGEFEQKFSKNSNARGPARGGMLKLRFDWYIIQFISNHAFYQYFLQALTPAPTFTLKLLVYNDNKVIRERNDFTVCWKYLFFFIIYLFIYYSLMAYKQTNKQTKQNKRKIGKP